MAPVEDVEQAVLLELSVADGETLPKTIIERLQRKPEITGALVSEAIWRLVASHRIRFTKSLRLRANGAGVPPKA